MGREVVAGGKEAVMAVVRKRGVNEEEMKKAFAS